MSNISLNPLKLSKDKIANVCRYPPNVRKALDGVVFIASHLASADDSRRVIYLYIVVIDLSLFARYCTRCSGLRSVTHKHQCYLSSCQPLTCNEPSDVNLCSEESDVLVVIAMTLSPCAPSAGEQRNVTSPSSFSDHLTRND